MYETEPVFFLHDHCSQYLIIKPGEGGSTGGREAAPQGRDSLSGPPGFSGGQRSPGVGSDCHFAVQLDHFIPVFRSYSVALFFVF